MSDYSNLSDQELKQKVKTWNIIQTVALILFGLGFLAWIFVDSWGGPMVFILLMGSISTIILFFGQGPRQMAAELEQRKLGR
ncbi:MAG: hypothetical protein AB8G95_00890 [Anaerolineae bacterium]